VALGPKPRSYRQRTPKKMVQLALRSALSDRASAERVAVVDQWPWAQPKTADARNALVALGLEGKILIVLDRDRDHDAYRSFRNLPHVQLMLSGELNAYDILCNDWVVFGRHNVPGTGTEVIESEATPPAVPVVAAEPEVESTVNEAEPADEGVDSATAAATVDSPEPEADEETEETPS
jgi:large subunit ribosomal protein L4